MAKFLPMIAYTDHPQECPKCGNIDVPHLEYQPGRRECDHQKALSESGEHLHCKCRRCSAIWTMAVFRVGKPAQAVTDRPGFRTAT